MAEKITKNGQEFDVVWQKPNLQKNDMHYCPGCAHGTLEKMLQEVIDEKGIQNRIIGVSPVGCAVFAYDYMNCDMQEAAHGRACALATGIKRVLPNHAVFTIQGDGDLASIGIAETLHACNRGESILILFYNNAIYGMTGGQMAPTTLPGQVTASSPDGRDVKTTGMPLKVADIVKTFDGTCFVTRQAANNAVNVRKLKKAIEKGIENSLNDKGTSFIELVGNCPSGWKMTPVDSYKWWEENMLKYYPLGDLKTEGGLK
jgi:2-oxoglutarate ferredoxin oxidoreductase subunit beta